MKSKPIVGLTAPGHSAKEALSETEDDWAVIECECGWVEVCEGFDSAVIAYCAYEDHLKEVAEQARRHEALLEDAEYMKPKTREFVRSSLEAWENLPESERHVPRKI